MVQNVSAHQSYGAINRMGITQDGRVVYQVVASDGREAGQMTVPQAQADVFEKSYRTMLKTAPLVQEYAMNSTPEMAEKMQKKAKRISLAGALIGGLTPMLLLRKGRLKSGWFQVPATILGLVGGMVAGTAVAGKVATPPGSMDFMKATQTMSKLDIQPYGQNYNRQA